ncbi:MAG: DUF1275 domain-containing protein [Cereibacter sphaeroides]|uniref:DUF1275 domain-containing protein n=1 Tax=Cereibacter sphaeroides TaxID=1063 RepID=A0A2W5S593_CERSP|nr:MAG: DUF1275 domain-containing protein [Cereibacter sphaeroides]
MVSHDRTSQLVAIGLATVAGFTDAIGFLSLGGAFVSFMSGNSTSFAVAVGGDTGIQAAALLMLIILLFVLGVMAGTLIRHFEARFASAVILLFMAIVLTISLALYAYWPTSFAIALTAVAMGAANNVFVRKGEVSIGVTYMTGTLVKFAQLLAGRLLGYPVAHWLPYLGLWLGLVGGAILGTLCYRHFGFPSIVVSIVACLLFATAFRHGNGQTDLATTVK